MAQPRTITLREYQDEFFEPHELDYADAEIIYRKYREKVEINVPSMVNNNRWQLKSLGWVGSIPVSERLRLVLEPKIPVTSIFRMFEYAYRLKSFMILKGIAQSDQLDDLYQQLANILARRVLDRSRRGFYRSYVHEEDQLAFIRGSIDIAQSLRSPWSVDLHCAYQEHTADVDDNQLLAWTLYTIARQGICTDEALNRVRGAWRSLHGVATTQPFSSSDCIGRLYNRLNEDYRPLHALCRFFLEQSGPSHAHGKHEMLPFLVNMAQLYEMYVAEFLAQQLPPNLRLTPQHKFILTDDHISITIDMVLTDTITDETVAVLDTKYKRAPQPSSDDLQQIVAYAAAKKCRRGILIYPVMPTTPFNTHYGASGIEVITTTVSADGEIGEGLLRVIRGEGISDES